MSRRARGVWTWIALVAIGFSGCQPTQPFFYMEDGDLSHYIDVATKIEYPDVDQPRLAEVDGAMAPITLRNADSFDTWDITLEEVIHMTMANSDVMRPIGGRVVSNAPDTLTRNIVSTFSTVTTYDNALLESGYGAGTGVPQAGTGVEAALAAFDAQFTTSVLWNNNHQPLNTPVTGFTIAPAVLDQDLGTFRAEIGKSTADGSQFFIRNNTLYDSSNRPFRAYPSDWLTNIEAGFSHPLLQGRGTQYNRIAGPFSFNQYAAGQVNPFDGVMIARIRLDQQLADFEGGVRNLIRDIESEYWELYFAYRNLEARKAGRDSAHATWMKVNELAKLQAEGGGAQQLAQAQAQYFAFQADVETSFSDLVRTENRLRYMLGLTHTDGRLIRPADDPTTAEVDFDWDLIHQEGLVRRVEIRKQKWTIKQRELQLIAARNHLLPRLDVTGQYRWIGRGDKLLDNDGNGIPFFRPGSNAFETLTGGEFQEWELGLQFTMPIGNRIGQTTVRHHQLLMARERKLLEEVENEVSHQVADALRDVHRDYKVAQTRWNGVTAERIDVRAAQDLLDAGRGSIDLLLEAQRRLSDAQVQFFRAVVDYNISIMRLHERKGTLLDYNNVLLAEGPWPGKAYFDALRKARRRDASLQLDYGFTRPNVISRGPYDQKPMSGPVGDIQFNGPAMPAVPAEEIPQPMPDPPTNGQQPGGVLPGPDSGDVRRGTTPPTLSEILGGSADPIINFGTLRKEGVVPAAAAVEVTPPPKAAEATQSRNVEPVVFRSETSQTSSAQPTEPKKFNPLRRANEIPTQATPPKQTKTSLEPAAADIGWKSRS